MAWSGGTYTKGNNSTGGWTGDAASGIGIEAGRHDTQDNDFATGINQCLNKDGSNAATGNLNIGNFKLTAVANGTASTDATNYGQVEAGINKQSTTLSITNTRFSADATGPVFALQKSRGASVGTNTIVQSGDIVGALNFNGANGTTYSNAAQISAVVDGTPGASNDMPGALKFSTTPDGSGTLTERLRITSAGNFGFNAPSPGYRIQVSCNTYNSGIAISGDGTNIGAFLHFLDNGTQRNVIHWDVGGFVSGSVNSLVARSGLTGGVYLPQTGTAWVAVSDARYKKNVKELEYGLTEINNLRPIRFDYIDDDTDNSSRLGFIAQEVQTQIPEAIQGSEELKLGLSATDLIPALVNAIKQLNAKVEALQAQVDAL